MFIKKTFLRLDNYWKFNGVLGFNPFYYAEIDLVEPLKAIGKKFLIIHKESVHTPAAHAMNFEIYRDQNKKHFANNGGGAVRPTSTLNVFMCVVLYPAINVIPLV